ncbi:hypothetical protein [Oricola cellulosilytica]|uniref:DUF4148 domain-containing protein n=1 Tax=Oricola cellulosilytica TaxID=1429082 RepID=A0A4R0PCA7_9HYPH|nr:hypothetical protein [Oricola cellulosilytica]TCD14163.1 hypothetical protein E0D97_08725 [Oricola cellulosilytica]
MKTLIASAAIVLATSSGAFAASTALDAYEPVKNEVAVDYTATAATGIDNALVERERLGDGSPQYQ